MGCLGLLLGMILRAILLSMVAFRWFPLTILGGAGIGTVVGLIIALIRGDFGFVLLGFVMGILAGAVFELAVRIAGRRRSRHL